MFFFYRTTSVADLYNGYSSDILEFIFSQDQFLSMKTFYTSFFAQYVAASAKL